MSVSAAAWDPAQYLRFAGPRLQPAIDLLSRIELSEPRRVVDLGCGTGTSTSLLAQRWPRAAIIGVDDSPQMLASARAEQPEVVWREADIGSWKAETPADVIFSNAALHWLDHHENVFPGLLGQVHRSDLITR